MFFSNSDGGELKLYFVAEVRLGIMSRGEVGLTPEGLHSFARLLCEDKTGWSFDSFSTTVITRQKKKSWHSLQVNQIKACAYCICGYIGIRIQVI